MDVGYNELELIRFLKSKHIKDALFYLIIGFILEFVASYLLIDSLIKKTDNIPFIIIISIFAILMFIVICFGIKELIIYLKIRKDYLELEYKNVVGKPDNVKLILMPKSRKIPAPVISDIVFIYGSIRIIYHIMYAYEKQNFDVEKIKNNLLKNEYNFDYLVNSHISTKLNSKIEQIMNETLKKIKISVNF